MPPLNSGLNGEKTANISGEKLEAHLLNLPNSMFSMSMLKEKNCANFSSAYVSTLSLPTKVIPYGTSHNSESNSLSHSILQSLEQASNCVSLYLNESMIECTTNRVYA